MNTAHRHATVAGARLLHFVCTAYTRGTDTTQTRANRCAVAAARYAAPPEAARVSTLATLTADRSTDYNV